MEDWKKLLAEQEIAPRYVNCDFKNHPALTGRWNEIAEYINSPKENILMSGTCGNGKTLTAICIMAGYTARRGRGARYYNAETLYPAWFWESRNGSPGDLARRVSDAPLLIVDDIGQGEITDPFKRWIYSIINKRWEWERPTVITTNLSSSDFRDLFGDALLSRVSSGKIWKFEGRDHRIIGS